MKPKYQVFVSSTYEDLEEERRAVFEQILNMGHIPVGMELFQASNQSQWDYITKRIASCDYFVVVIAERYGWVGPEGKSFTRLEYEYARDHGIPFAALLLSEEGRRIRPRDQVESARQTEIEDFRKYASHDVLCKYWLNAGDLASKVGYALNELEVSTPRPGWIPADSVLLKQLIQDDPESKLASSTLIKSVDRELEIAGYYRKNQVLEFEVEAVASGFHISLVFSSDIVPVRNNTLVYKPRIEPPEGVKLLDSKYFVRGEEIDDVCEITGRTQDRLCVTYETTEPGRQVWQDSHHWPCPVLDYTVKFRKRDAFRFGVGRLVGQKSPAPIMGSADQSGEWLLYRGQTGELTAQGLKWKISRTN